MDTDRLLRMAGKLGYEDAESLLKLCRPAWRLKLRPRGTKPLPLGSRLGGLPALSRGAPWPTFRGKSLSFICQLDLKGLSVAVGASLPKSGLLSFFYSADQCCWGGDPEEAGAFVVRYAESPRTCTVPESWPADLPPEARFRPCPVDFVEVMTVAPHESLLAESVLSSDVAMDSYTEVSSEISAALDRGGAWAYRSLLLGHPDQIQGDLSLHFAEPFVMLGKRAHKRGAGPMPGKVKEVALNSRMLLQVHSCRAAGMMWGDLGCLYYWIQDTDLKARDFSRALGILQCG